jgi:hypothetical protein
MRRHVGAQTLAGFRHGDLSPRRTSRIYAHLAGCARCRELNSDLAGVTTLLAAAQPPPIPEHLATRIQTALAAEAAMRAAQTAAGEVGTEAAPPAPAPPGGRSPRHERPGHARRRPLPPGLSSPLALRTAAAAAAVVVIAGGAYEVVQHVGSSSPARSTPGAGAARVPRTAGPLITSGAAPGLHYLHDGRQASITPVTTSVNFTPANLRSEVSSELSRHGAVKAAGSAAAAPAAQPTPSYAQSYGSALQDCVNRIAAGHQVLLVEIARYQGAPATVIVTVSSGADPEQAWVVGPGCSAGRSDVLAHVTLAAGG